MASVAGRELAIRHAVPGSRVRATVTGRRRGRLEGRVLEVLEPGPHSVAPRCDHFGTCGGCAFQTLAYPRQLAELQRSLVSMLAARDLLRDVAVEPVQGCADPWHYRNKMDFTFSNRRWVEADEPEGARADFALGLHVPFRWDKVLDIRACAIHFREADALLASTRELALEQGLEPWDTKAHTGLLRHLVLRKGFRTGEIMANIVTAREAPEALEPFAAALLARHPELTTIVQTVNTRAASTAIGEWERVLHGDGVIHEVLLGITYTISAGSFFQTNTAQAERLLEVVREEAACGAGDVVYDLYCGAGAIGLALAKTAGEVLGFESVPAAVEDARRNARANALANVRFVLGDVLARLAEEDDLPAPDVCVIDPPRSGMHPRMIPALVALAPERIIYVSCNVQASARDLPFLVAGGYRLARIRPIDLFPHTPHVECVFTLERRA